jgi:hypothetical protein
MSGDAILPTRTAQNLQRTSLYPVMPEQPILADVQDSSSRHIDR